SVIAVVVSRSVIPIGDVHAAHLRTSLCFYEPVPLFELPCALELGRLLALTRLELALTHLELALLVALLVALLLNSLRDPPLILHPLGARLSGTCLLAVAPLSIRRAASWVAVALVGFDLRGGLPALNLRRDLPALILAVVMIVLPALRLG